MRICHRLGTAPTVRTQTGKPEIGRTRAWRALIGKAFVAVASLLSIVVAATPATALDTSPLTVEILSTSDVEGNIDTFSPGDFYARISIDDEPTFDSPKQNFEGGIGQGFLYPFTVATDWATTAFHDPSNTAVPVVIELKDDDDGFGGPDDVADISPADTDTLNLLVDPTTGAITGDVSATVGDIFFSVGSDDERAEISLRITLSDPGDADGDGLLDTWETDGHPNGLDLPALGADPQRRDLFLEIDCMASDGDSDGTFNGPADHTHCPSATALQQVVQAFANAPVANPDGTTGIQLHIDVGTAAGPTLQLVAGTGGVTGSFGPLGTSPGGGEMFAETGNTVISLNPASTNPTLWDLKSLASNREPVFRYGVFAHQVDARVAGGDCTSGVGELAGNDFIVSLGGQRTATTTCWASDGNGFSVGSTTQQAGTLMHEFGHNLGLGHGGGDSINLKPNYLSVMNYRNLAGLLGTGGSSQFCGVPANFTGSVAIPGGCDFSRVAVDLTELAPGTDECLGIDEGGFLNFGQLDFDADLQFQGATCTTGTTNNLIAVDINGDQTVDDDSDMTVDEDGLNSVDDDGDGLVDEDTSIDALNGFDDWQNLFWRFRDSAAFEDGNVGPNPPVVDYRPEDLEAAQSLTDAQTAPELLGTFTGPSEAVNGETIEFSLDVTNIGRGPAFDATAVVTGPAGAALADRDAPQMLAGQSFETIGSYTVPADACPSTIAIEGALSARGMSLLETSSSSVYELSVLDEEAPTLTVSADPDLLWPPNHKMREITVTVVVSDRCDLAPVVRLESIVSNQADDGAGDGSTSDDINAAIGTDDRDFKLRAERSQGQDRVYEITYSATDASGNVTTATTEVAVASRR